MKPTIHPSSKQSILKLCIISILFLTTCFTIPIVQANTNGQSSASSGSDSSGTGRGGIISKITNWVNGEDAIGPANNLSFLDISEMRVRDIKRRLSRQHGYGADEIAMMLDKKELINALAFEEHKAVQKEKDRKKKIALRRSIVMALVCVIVVMFKGLFFHVFEVASVNFVVYTGKFNDYYYSQSIITHCH